MTALQHQHGPWAQEVALVNVTRIAIVCDAQSRRDILRESTDAEWLRAVIRDRNTQLHVRVLATSRLRRVMKECK